MAFSQKIKAENETDYVKKNVPHLYRTKFGTDAVQLKCGAIIFVFVLKSITNILPLY